MNQLQQFNFNGNEIRTIEKNGEIIFQTVLHNGRPIAVVVDGVEMDRYQLLAFASKASTYSKTNARAIMSIASNLFHWQDDWAFNYLYGAVALEITNDWSKTEMDLHRHFEMKIADVLGLGAKVVHVKPHPKHRPDSWVRFGGENVPVEIKLGKFDGKALKQLERYMRVYGSSAGIAVGASASVDIPDNVIFISSRELGWNYKEVRTNESHRHGMASINRR